MSNDRSGQANCTCEHDACSLHDADADELLRETERIVAFHASATVTVRRGDGPPRQVYPRLSR